MNPIQAKAYYHWLVTADRHGSYHECPEITQKLKDSLGIDFKIPEKFGWGTVGSLNGEIAVQLKKKYPIELMLALFNEFFHVVVYEDRIDIIGRDMMAKFNRSILCKTGIADVVSIGFISSLLDSYSADIKKFLESEVL